MVNYLLANSQVVKDQNGLLYKRSCLAKFIGFLNEITSKVDRGKIVKGCTLNYQNAFAFANKMLLDQKLKAFVADAKAKNREQRVWRVGPSGCLLGVGMLYHGKPNGQS